MRPLIAGMSELLISLGDSIYSMTMLIIPVSFKGCGAFTVALEDALADALGGLQDHGQREQEVVGDGAGAVGGGGEVSFVARMGDQEVVGLGVQPLIGPGTSTPSTKPGVSTSDTFSMSNGIGTTCWG